MSIVTCVFVFIFKLFIWRFQNCTKQSSYMLLTQLPPLLASYIIIVQWLKLKNKLICTIFKDFTYKWYHMIFVFLWLTSLSKTIARYIHVAANDIIFSFLWLSGIFLWRRKWQPTPVFLQENSMDRGAWWAAVHRAAQSWTRLKRLGMHACIGEGNGNPPQSSCLENPRDWGAWWAAVCGVAHDWSTVAAAAVFSYTYIYLLYSTGNSPLSTL